MPARVSNGGLVVIEFFLRKGDYPTDVLSDCSIVDRQIRQRNAPEFSVSTRWILRYSVDRQERCEHNHRPLVVAHVCQGSKHGAVEFGASLVDKRESFIDAQYKRRLAAVVQYPLAYGNRIEVRLVRKRRSIELLKRIPSGSSKTVAAFARTLLDV